MLLTALMVSALIGQGISYSKVYLFHLLLGVCLAFKFRFKTFIKFIRQQYLLVGMLLFAATSLLWSISVMDGLRDVAVMGIGVVFLYFITESQIRSKTLLKCIHVVSWLNITLSLFEAFDVFRYPLSFYSKSGQLFGKIFSGYDIESVPTGFFYNPNNNAFFILIFSPIIFSTLKGWKFFLYLFLSTFIVFMASSKLILVAWVVLLGISIFLLLKTKIGALKSFLLFSCLIVGMGLLMNFTDSNRVSKYSKIYPSLKTFVLLAPVNFFKRLTGEEVKFDYKIYDISLHERLTFLDGVAAILNDRWATGVGAGSLMKLKTEQAGLSLKLGSPHFYFFELAAKFGIFFVIVYLVWLFKLFNAVYVKNRFFGLSLLLFIVFNPVMSSAMYFLPKWALYGFLINFKNEELDQ